MFADRRRLLIGGAVLVLVVLAVWLTRSPGAGTAAPASAVRPRGQTPAPAGADAVQPLNLDALVASREEPNETLRRNPFRFQPKVVAPPPRPPVAPIVETAPRPMVPAPPAGPPPPPPIALKFIAILERANGVKWAVLSDGKSPPMYGKDGDVIDGRYRIVKIGTESVELTHLDGRGRQVVRLSGQ